MEELFFLRKERHLGVGWDRQAWKCGEGKIRGKEPFPRANFLDVAISLVKASSVDGGLSGHGRLTFQQVT